jgi:metal-responsive CopG/Arc/MetJ family transcriptional regulator
MKKRSAQSYSIDDELYARFLKIVNEKNINKSKLIESLIEEYVNQNEKK